MANTEQPEQKNNEQFETLINDIYNTEDVFEYYFCLYYNGVFSLDIQIFGKSKNYNIELLNNISKFLHLYGKCKNCDDIHCNLSSNGLCLICSNPLSKFATECPICFDDEVDNKTVATLTCCKKTIHYECIIDKLRCGHSRKFLLECSYCRHSHTMIVPTIKI